MPCAATVYCLNFAEVIDWLIVRFSAPRLHLGCGTCRSRGFRINFRHLGIFNAIVNLDTRECSKYGYGAIKPRQSTLLVHQSACFISAYTEFVRRYYEDELREKATVTQTWCRNSRSWIPIGSDTFHSACTHKIAVTAARQRIGNLRTTRKAGNAEALAVLRSALVQWRSNN